MLVITLHQYLGASTQFTTLNRRQHFRKIDKTAIFSGCQNIKIYRYETNTLGLNWYVSSRVRFSANMIFVDTDEYAGNEDPIIFQLRGQIDFEV